MRLTILVGLMLTAAIPATGQTRTTTGSAEPDYSFRPFFVAKGHRFAASQTFEAAFESRFSPFWGGGLEVDIRPNTFVEIAASRFSKSGQRAFVSDGQAFRLGIPLKATVTPIEVTAGVRFPVTRRPPRGRVATQPATPTVIPYVGGGVGWYKYTETSTFADSGENIDASHAGFVAVGGVEVRLHPWIGVAVDAQFTRVTGILGSAGISKEFGETNLGGTALRVKVLVGR